MARLVVVSNRVAKIEKRGSPSSGGLAMALQSALREQDGFWFGWSGERVEQATLKPRQDRIAGVNIAQLDLEPQDVDEYYNGFANRTLWPLCHYRMDLAEYERSFNAGYLRVNERFAQSLAPLLREDDVIWVHDYHLIPLGAALRELGFANRIGFFLHIPWPARELFTTLPRHHKLVESMFAYDIVGFQSACWLRAFEDYVTGELNLTVGSDGVIEAPRRDVLARAYPIGLNVTEMRELGKSDAALDACNAMRSKNRDTALLLGVDRIDYSKGLPQKFDAFGQFLSDNSDRRGRVSLLQIGQPSRTEVDAYRELNETLQAKAGAINAEFGTLNWSPLRYRNQSQGRDSLAGAYQAADVMLVTPLRDGMNLVAKEFIAAQDPSDPGVLILSRFAGAAEQMREALLVNPYSREDVADAIRQALDMPLSERIVRWKALYNGICREDLDHWKENFLRDLTGPQIPAEEPRALAEPLYNSWR